MLIAHGVHALSWTSTPEGGRTAWTVGGSLPRVEKGLFGLRMALWPNAQLSLRAKNAAFFTGDVPGLDEIPDYGQDDDAAVRAALAGWNSELVPLHAVYLDQATVQP